MLHPANLGLQPITHLGNSESDLRQLRCGTISIRAGASPMVQGRWWPYQGNLLRSFWDQRFRPVATDRCDLHYHVPGSGSSVLTLDYIRSGPRTALSTFYSATLVLDEIARLKDSSIIVCHVTNRRISTRLMQRWGWDSHCPGWSGRHFIKRLYGDHPTIPSVWRDRLGMRSLAPKVEPAGSTAIPAGLPKPIGTPILGSTEIGGMNLPSASSAN